jgi:hypothetical protein
MKFKFFIAAFFFLCAVNIGRSQKTITANDQGIVDLPLGATSECKALVLSTNFVIPMIRFNTVTSASATNNQKGNVSLFNSVGAGVSLNWGRLVSTTDAQGNIISSNMKNQFGLQLGILFAVNSGTSNNTNVFAPTASFSVLNFEVGIGYELGSLPTGQNAFFYTIAYGIPISKLLDGGSWIIKPKLTVNNQSQTPQRLF